MHNRFRYTGEQYDPLTGQYYLRARYYNPVSARFTQEDTYYGDGLNLYAYCKNNPVVYYDPSGYKDKRQTPCKEETSVGESGAGESGSGTGTVWDNITPTQENYPYTNIPKSFEIEVNGEKMWVHGNATEHMYEDVYKGITTGNGTAYTNPNLYTQEIMSDFCGSLQEATKSGIVYGEKITQGNWEFIFAQPRQAGQLPVIKHAQFNGWH